MTLAAWLRRDWHRRLNRISHGWLSLDAASPLLQFSSGEKKYENSINQLHDDVIKWKHFPRYFTFVRGIHLLPMIYPHKGEWRGTLVFSLICAWTNDWVSNRDCGDLRRHRAHYDAIVMSYDLHAHYQNAYVIMHHKIENANHWLTLAVRTLFLFLSVCNLCDIKSTCLILSYTETERQSRWLLYSHWLHLRWSYWPHHVQSITTK